MIGLMKRKRNDFIRGDIRRFSMKIYYTVILVLVHSVNISETHSIKHCHSKVNTDYGKGFANRNSKRYSLFNKKIFLSLNYLESYQ